MRVAVVSCVFPPEPVVSARTTFDVARALAARGHDVTVIAPFPRRPSGRLYAGFSRSLFRSGTAREGFRVVRCASLPSRQSSLLSRLGENVSFGVTSSLALLVAGKPAVVYANTWPIFAAAMVALIARLRGIPLVLSIQDVYPESLIAQRRRGSMRAARMLRAIDGWVARSARAVVVLSAAFAELYRRTRGVDARRILVVPNWSSPGETGDPRVASRCRERHGVPPDAFLLAYGGNVGIAASVETVIEAFRLLRGPPTVHLLVAGEGAALERCQRLAAEIAPRRIHFEYPWSDTSGVLEAADAAVLPTRREQTAASVPSKLISYLLAGRPILAAVGEGSETAAVVRASGAGLVVAPEDPTAFATALRALIRLPPAVRQQMGDDGRRWAMANVTAEICLPRLLEVVEAKAR